MKSILENRPGLAKEVNKVAEVAGYLWQKGWAERNGGNITINITEFVDDEIRRMQPISEVRSIGVTLPYLKGCYFYCKGTNKRMRDLARWPMENGSVIRILDDCASYVIIADEAVVPTSELPSHLSVHNDLLSKNSPYKASVHTHPIELIAMTHCEKFLQKDVATNLLWSMIPETKAFCPRGLGIIPSVRSFCFEIIYGILLIVQKGHSMPDGQGVALNVRPLQPKRFFLTKPAVQTEGAEYAGAWFYDYTHQNIDLIGKQSLFLFRFSVRGDFDTLSRIINNQMIQTCFLKKLAHSQKNFTLQAFRSGCNAGHNLSDVNWFYVSEFHVSDLFHDVEIIAIPVHFDGSGP